MTLFAAMISTPHVGQHELDRLEIPQCPPELAPLGRPGVRELEGPDRRAETVRGDLQARLDEPVLGEREAAPISPSTLSAPTSTSSNRNSGWPNT